MTAILGGSTDRQEIVTLDWKTLKYTKQEERFEGKRWKSACAVARDSNGEPVVFVAGGLNTDSKGMEAWYPNRVIIIVVVNGDTFHQISVGAT
jgi:hypothetical protein